MKSIRKYLLAILVLGFMLSSAPAKAQITLSGVGSFNELATRCVSGCLGEPGLLFISGTTGWSEVGNTTHSFASFNLTTGIVFGVNLLMPGVYDLFGWNSGTLVASATVDGNNFMPYIGVVPTSADMFAAANVGVAAPIPEPETYALMLAGLAILGLATRRRRQKELSTQNLVAA